jgi:hypothetical protein
MTTTAEATIRDNGTIWGRVVLPLFPVRKA